MGFFEKIKQGLQKTRQSVISQVDGLLKAMGKIDEELFEELEELLIMADVGAAASSEIVETLRERVKERKVTDPAAIKGLLREIVTEMLDDGQNGLKLTTRPSVILMVGVNGVGKTTTIAKLAASYKKEGRRIILAAADTFRAGAIDQLKVWAERVGVDIVGHKEGADPAAVVYDTVQAAAARGCDLIICDTAGRLHNKKNLMDELSKISRVIDRELPSADREVLLVIDAATGQNGVNQAREFKSIVPVTGIVLTKLDGTARGGIVLSIKKELDIPVRYVGVGEQMDDLQAFEPAAFAEALFE